MRAHSLYFHLQRDCSVRLLFSFAAFSFDFICSERLTLICRVRFVFYLQSALNFIRCMRSTYIYVLDFYCVHVNTLLFAAYAFGFYLQSAFDLIRSVFDFVCSVTVFVMYVFLVCSVVTNGPPYFTKDNQSPALIKSHS